MSDIFISYASVDRPQAKTLAEALAAQDWSVWWDRTLLPGKEFDEVIEHELDQSRCVIVPWSETSVGVGGRSGRGRGLSRSYVL